MSTTSTKYYRIYRDASIMECLTCRKRLRGLKLHNMKRHYITNHNIEIQYPTKRKRRIKLRHTLINNEIDYQKAVNNVELSLEPETGSYCNEEEYIIEPDEYISSSKRKKLNVSLTETDDQTNIDSRNSFLKCCVALVAVKGIPASLFDDRESFKKLIAPQEEKFCTNLYSDDISILLQRSISSIRDIIASKVRNKMLSLKLDIATGIYSKVLNISIQYMEDFKIYYNTLDIIQLSNTAIDIKDDILNCLENYKINKKQVYCYLTDVTSKAPNRKFESKNKTKDVDQIYNSVTKEFREIKNVTSIIELVVNKAISKLNIDLTQNRVLVRKLKSKYLECLDRLVLDDDNDMNWVSSYEMLKSLFRNKTCLEEKPEIKSGSSELQLNWIFIKDFISALTPLLNLQEQLNNEQYIFGDFYRDWLNCEIELEELSQKSSFAKAIAQSMQNYKKELLNTEEFLSALYLDPRFNFCSSIMLSEEQKHKAEAHLCKLYKIINTMLKNENPTLLTETIDFMNILTVNKDTEIILPKIKSEENSKIPHSINRSTQMGLRSIVIEENVMSIVPNDYENTEKINGDKPSTSKKAYDKLTQRIMNLNSELSKIDESQRNFRQKLIILLSNKMMSPLDTNILEYWKSADLDPDIKEVLEAALTVPITQATIGRAAYSLELSNEGKIDRDLLLTKYNFAEISDNDVEK